MIDFTPYRNVEVFLNNPALKISLDTLRTICNKETIIKYFGKREFEVKEIKSHSRISAHAKRMLWTKQVTSLKQVITPRFKNIITTTPHHLNQGSDYKKVNLIAFGLSQPNKPLHVETKRELKYLFDKFGVSSYDLSIDTPKGIDTSLLSHFGEVTSKYSTIYINKPNLSHIKKICYYDKAQKDNLSQPLFRLEATITTSGKFGEMFIPEQEINQIINTVR